jgi:hypothetical protein
MQGVWRGNVDGLDLWVQAKRFEIGIAGNTKIAFKLCAGEGLGVRGTNQLNA